MEKRKEREIIAKIMKINVNRKPELGLALSGGGARGLAHIGVLKVLEAYDLQPDYLAGTSMGGVIAAAYASGVSPGEMEQIAFEYAATRKLLLLADPIIPSANLHRLQSTSNI